MIDKRPLCASVAVNNLGNLLMYLIKYWCLSLLLYDDKTVQTNRAANNRCPVEYKNLIPRTIVLLVNAVRGDTQSETGKWKTITISSHKSTDVFLDTDSNTDKGNMNTWQNLSLWQSNASDIGITLCYGTAAVSRATTTATTVGRTTAGGHW